MSAADTTDNEQTFQYIWTTPDHDLLSSGRSGKSCGGKYPLCPSSHAMMDAKGNNSLVRPCYVTPYGIPGKNIQGTPEVGKPIRLDLADSIHGECGRAARFGVQTLWYPAKALKAAERRDKQKGGWVKLDWSKLKNKKVETLGELCNALMALDSARYPKSFYGVTGKGFENAARVLFDYRRHTKYRAAVIEAQDKGLTTYSQNPESIPVRLGEHALTHIYEMTVSVSDKAGAPDKKTTVVVDLNPFDTQKALTYAQQLAKAEQITRQFIADVEQRIANIRGFQKLASDSLEKRFRPISRLHAAKTVAECCRDFPHDKDQNDAPELIKYLEKSIEDAVKWAQTTPVASDASRNDILAEEQIKEQSSGVVARKLTSNAGDEILRQAEKLRKLLFHDTDRVDAIAMVVAAAGDLTKSKKDLYPPPFTITDKLNSWAGKFVKPDIDKPLWDLAMELVRVTNEAVDVLADVGHQEDRSRDYAAILTSLPKDTATEIAKVLKTNALVAVASLGGTTLKVGQDTVKLYYTLLHLAVVRETLSLSKSTFAQLGKSMRVLDDATAGAFRSVWHDFIKKHAKLCPAIDGVQLDDVLAKAALDAGDDGAQAVETIRNKIAANNANLGSSPWGKIMLIAQAFTLAAAIPEMTSTGDELKVIDFAVGGTELVLGVAEKVLEGLAHLESALAMVAKLGQYTGALAAAVALMQGIVQYVEACKQGNLTGSLKNAAAIAGSLATLIAVCAALAGVMPAAIPVLAAIALACAIINGLISIGEFVRDARFTGSMIVIRNLLAPFIQNKGDMILRGIMSAAQVSIRDAYDLCYDEVGKDEPIMGKRLPLIHQDAEALRRLVAAGLPFEIIRECTYWDIDRSNRGFIM